MKVLIVVSALLALASSISLHRHKVYAFGTRTPLTTASPIPILNTEDVERKQLLPGTPTLIPVASPFLPSTSGVNALLVLPSISAPQVPKMESTLPADTLSEPMVQQVNASPEADIQEGDLTEDAAPPTTSPMTSQETAPLTAPDLESLQIRELMIPQAPISSTTTTTTIAPPTKAILPTNRGILQAVSSKFGGKINQLISEIVDDVIEQTKESVHNSINTHLG